MPAQHDHETATLGGGCFWCLEAVYKDLKGVERVVSGYAGGQVAEPDLRAGLRRPHRPRRGRADHLRSGRRLLRELLDVFFTIHDPTTPDRQGADIGPQYRSIILYHSPEQKADAERAIAEQAEKGVWDAPIVTEVVPLATFYPAEDYHQDYYERNPRQRYCQIVIAPKVAKFRKQYLERLKR